LKALVLGFGPQSGEKPQLLAKVRLAAAHALFEKGDVDGFILSGGRTGESPLTEARAMKHYLIGLGASEDVIWLEEESTNSLMNIVNILNGMYERRFPKTSLALVTNSFHLRRIQIIFEMVGGGCYQFLSAEDILGQQHPFVKESAEATRIASRNEERWIRELLENAPYSISIFARLADTRRLRNVLSMSPFKEFILASFGVNAPELTDENLKGLRGSLIMVERRLQT